MEAIVPLREGHGHLKNVPTCKSRPSPPATEPGFRAEVPMKTLIFCLLSGGRGLKDCSFEISMLGIVGI